MAEERLCIICDERKPVSRFETKGEHIVPRSLGNRKFRTPFVCTDCNNGLGGTVDAALKNVPAVALACYDRGVCGRTGAINPAGSASAENPDVKGAVLKIAYEAAHLRLGNNWLRDPAAAAIRDALSSYVNKDREKAHRLMDDIVIYDMALDIFYYSINRRQSPLVKHAIISKSCLNALWMARINALTAVVLDIEGLAPGYVAVSDSDWGIDTPELLAPRIKGA